MNKICTVCIMDATDKDITFNSLGICNHCIESQEKINKYTYSKKESEKNLNDLFLRIKSRESKSKYDSIIGLSGGVDSSYMAYLAYVNGLNPLCVHFDNGWNSNIAIKNIKNIINITGFDLHTEVINWQEFRDLQRSFIQAGVVDIEMLTDHAIFASLFNKVTKFDIKTVLSGFNYMTEHGMPISWTWSKMDFTNIKAIHKKFGKKQIKSYPHMSNIKWNMMRRFNYGGVFEDPLNLINYNTDKAKIILKKKFEWQDYGNKHEESVFTKFYQSYILPKKFSVDKRKVHLSCNIRAGFINRGEAIKITQIDAYGKDDLRKDKRFVLKKLGFSDEEFDEIMSRSPVPHNYYKTDQIYIKPLIWFGKIFFGKKKI